MNQIFYNSQIPTDLYNILLKNEFIKETAENVVDSMPVFHLKKKPQVNNTL